MSNAEKWKRLRSIVEAMTEELFPGGRLEKFKIWEPESTYTWTRIKKESRNVFQVGDMARLDSVSGIAWSQDKPKVGTVFQVTSVESGGDWLALKGLSELWSASRFTKVSQDDNNKGEKNG